MMEPVCRYTSPEGETCTEQDLGNGYCFWHDPQSDKSGLNLTEKLERFARKGGLTKGLQLKRAVLQGVDLVNRGGNRGYDFSYSDFYNAKLQGAHLFNIRLEHASLMKANLEDASLHCANLSGANLLGIKLHDTKMDNIDTGNTLYQEEQAAQLIREGRSEEAKEHIEQAEEVYRNLHKAAEQQGLFSLAGQFNYKEILMRRQLMKHWSLKWMFSHVIDWLCGYGEKPENTIIFSLLLIMICAVGYSIFGVSYNQSILRLNADAGIVENLNTFFISVYYSVVTFTTLGYGDITPIGITRLIAVIEAFLGSFTIALFVVVFVKRMSR